MPAVSCMCVRAAGSAIIASRSLRLRHFASLVT